MQFQTRPNRKVDVPCSRFVILIKITSTKVRENKITLDQQLPSLYSCRVRLSLILKNASKVCINIKLNLTRLISAKIVTHKKDK